MAGVSCCAQNGNLAASLIELQSSFFNCLQHVSKSELPKRIPISLFDALHLEGNISGMVTAEVDARIAAIRPCIQKLVEAQFAGVPQHNARGLLSQSETDFRNAAEHCYKNMVPFATVTLPEWKHMSRGRYCPGYASLLATVPNKSYERTNGQANSDKPGLADVSLMGQWEPLPHNCRTIQFDTTPSKEDLECSKFAAKSVVRDVIFRSVARVQHRHQCKWGFLYQRYLEKSQESEDTAFAMELILSAVQNRLSYDAAQRLLALRQGRVKDECTVK